MSYEIAHQGKTYVAFYFNTNSFFRLKSFVFYFTAFNCDHCDQKYAYRGDLNKHLKIHVGNNIYTCEQCGMGFRLPTEFRRHKFEHYKKDKEKR